MRSQASHYRFAKLRAGPDYVLLASLGVLISLGALMVFSTTAIFSEEQYGSSTALGFKHLRNVALGVISLVACAAVPLRWFRAAGPLAVVFCLFSLILVLVPGVGDVAGGARRWISVWGFRFQPGEFAKLALVIYFAGYIGRHRSQLQTFTSGVAIPSGIVCIISGLLLLQPDFGSTAVIALVVFTQLSLFTRLSHLGALFSAAGVVGFLAVYLEPYRWKRVTVFMDPFQDPSNAGYQLIQSLIAVGSGGIWGVGLGSGEQKLFYLPAAHTDFIFAVITEELGAFGAVVVLGLFAAVAWRGFSLARHYWDDAFLSSLATGATALVVIPAILNIAVVLGMLPTKGMVLPFVAYGGSALIMYCMIGGVLLNLSRGVGR